jgi:Secretion system C-terminal sorting domain
MKILFFILSCALATSAFSQCPAGTYIGDCTIQYKYDDAGNRIERSLKQACICITTPPGNGGGGGGRAANPTLTDNTIVETTDALTIAKIVPNPTTDGVTVQFSVAIEKGSVFITDATGKLLGEQVVSGSSADIDLSKYAAGIYYLTLRAAAAVHTQKVVKID